MKKKIILIIILFVGTISQLQTQTSDPAIDSMIAHQARPIIQANADLMDDLEKSFIKSRDFGQFKKILRIRNRSSQYIKNIAETKDSHVQLLVRKALKTYNKARKIYEQAKVA